MTGNNTVIVPDALVRDVTSRLADMPGLVVTTNGHLPPPVLTKGKVIVVVSPKGGSGKTAFATNLAVVLAERFPGAVAAVDLDVQFGDMCTSLGLHPEHNLAELARSSSIDSTTLKVFLTPYDQGLYVLCGARSPADADVVTGEHVSAVLPLLATDFAYVIVDTPAGLDDRTLAAIDQATDLLLVSSLDVTSIRSLRKAVDAMDVLGVNARRHFVINKADAKVGISPVDAAEAVGHPVAALINASQQVALSMNLGNPIVKLEPRSAVAKQMRQLSQLFTPAVEPDKKWWRRGR